MNKRPLNGGVCCCACVLEVSLEVNYHQLCLNKAQPIKAAKETIGPLVFSQTISLLIKLQPTSILFTFLVQELSNS